MTEIIRSIEIEAPRNRVWSYIHPCNWSRIFNFVKAVDGSLDEAPAVGMIAEVEAGGDTIGQVKYMVKITEFVEKERIAYHRFSGPLSGKGLIQLRALNTGTLLRRTSFYNDALSEQTIFELSSGMERDNLRLKQLVETSCKEG